MNSENGLSVSSTIPTLLHSNSNPNLIHSNPAKKKRNLPGTPDPDAEVIALSPKSLMATNRFVCEVCQKGFQRDQNLQLHRRGHNLPWKLRQRSNKEQVRKKVYVCPENNCVHHHPSRALGDLTGIKKHYSRKHGEKKWKCDKCSKKYAVYSDWKAHSKICGTRQYKCDCGTLFSRKDSFLTHRAFCDVLAEESARISLVPQAPRIPDHNIFTGFHTPKTLLNYSTAFPQSACTFPDLASGPSSLQSQWVNPYPETSFASASAANIGVAMCGLKEERQQEDQNKLGNQLSYSVTSSYCSDYDRNPSQGGLAKQPLLHHHDLDHHMTSATALLQKAAQMGCTTTSCSNNMISMFGMMATPVSSTTSFTQYAEVGTYFKEANQTDQSGLNQFQLLNSQASTRDFLGVGDVDYSINRNRPFLQKELAKFK